MHHFVVASNSNAGSSLIFFYSILALPSPFLLFSSKVLPLPYYHFLFCETSKRFLTNFINRMHIFKAHLTSGLLLFLHQKNPLPTRNIFHDVHFIRPCEPSYSRNEKKIQGGTDQKSYLGISSNH